MGCITCLLDGVLIVQHQRALVSCLPVADNKTHERDIFTQLVENHLNILFQTLDLELFEFNKGPQGRFSLCLPSLSTLLRDCCNTVIKLFSSSLLVLDAWVVYIRSENNSWYCNRNLQPVPLVQYSTCFTALKIHVFVIGSNNYTIPL